MRCRLQGLERGLAVIQAFSHATPSMTLSEVARQTDMSRATARRILLTLEGLGFVRSDGRQFALSPRVLSLGWAYLSSLNLWDIARPFMQDLSAEVEETCSACTLDLPDIVFVARVPSKRILMMSLGVGSRLPAYATAMGRVLLAGARRRGGRRAPRGVRARAAHPPHHHRPGPAARDRRRRPRAGLRRSSTRSSSSACAPSRSR